MTTREALKAIIDELPDFLLDDADRQLEALRRTGDDPVRRALAEAPYDDEPLSDEARTSIARAQERHRQGLSVPDEEVALRIGL